MSAEDESKQKVAAIHKLWTALIAPSWRADDLIDLGKAIHASVPLKDMPDARLNRLLPYLSQISTQLLKPSTPISEEKKNE